MSEIKITYTPTKPALAKFVYPDEKAISLEDLSAKIKSAVGAEVIQKIEKEHKGDAFLIVHPEKIWECLKFLRDEPGLEFIMLHVVSATDFLERKGQEGLKDEEARLEVLYVVHSFLRKQQLNLKVILDRQNPKLKSVADLFRCANWYERECYDLLGVEFTGHPDLERILLPPDWVGHPLRKDYEFPQEYNGMKVPL